MYKKKVKIGRFSPEMAVFVTSNIRMFSPRHDKNKRIALNVEHLVRGGCIIGVFATIPNGPQIAKTFSWY